MHLPQTPLQVIRSSGQMERALILAQRGPLRFDLPPAESEVPAPVAGQAVDAAGSEGQILTDPELRRRERANIVAALTRSSWRIHGPGGAAELLTINPSTLVSRIRKLGLKKPK